MKEHVKRMVQEHSELIVKIEKLDNFLYGNCGLNIHTDIKNNQTQDDLFRNMTEFANKCIQLSSMRTYLKALECRLNNEGVYYDNGEYFESIAKIIYDPINPADKNDTDTHKDNRDE